jgi:predicted metal-dependent hydrolase
MDERFERGLENFNRESFFEAHEILEDLWHENRETDRSFIQGLIQLSAAFYHLQSLNEKGARSQIAKGIDKLSKYQPVHGNIHVSRLLDETIEVREQIVNGRVSEMHIMKYPKIKFAKDTLISIPGL